MLKQSSRKQVEIMKALIASVNKETWRLKVLQDKQAKEAKDVERIRNKFSIMSIKSQDERNS
ncbi:hypothetical protein BC829DRAFT_278202 [Chytridium lagenaria]|nr:hypothetical protein BC829DRAFT_278202 [Chytridium lagenaria]